MKPTILAVALLFGSLAHAKEQRALESGTLLQMDLVECGADQKSGKSFAGEMLGTDAAHQKTQVLPCQEYVLQADRVIYRIRPKDGKHPVLLPVGVKAQFRLDTSSIRWGSCTARITVGDVKEHPPSPGAEPPSSFADESLGVCSGETDHTNRTV